MTTQAYSAGTTSILEYNIPQARMGEDKLLKSDYYTIIDNCMDLVRNSPVAKSVVQALEDYVAGSGLTPNAGNQTAMSVWGNWSFGRVDLAGTKTFNQVFRDIVSNIAATGDVLLTTPIDPSIGNDAISMRLELTSGARVLTPYDYQDEKDQFGNIVKFGVAFRDGVEVGYYIQKMDNDRVQGVGVRDARNFDYLEKYDRNTGRLNAILIRRPAGMASEQTRGLSILTPVFTAIKDLDDLIVTAIQGSRNKAHLSVILNTPTPNEAYSGLGAVDSEGSLIEATDNQGHAQIIGSLPDGAIMTAPEGTSAQVINSSGDIDRDALILRAQKLVSAGVGIPYEILFKDLSNINFSGGKLAFDSFFRLSQFWTNELIKVFQEINKWIQIEAHLKGFGVEDLQPENIILEFIGSQNYVDADPGKNSKAESERIGNNLTTSSRLLAQKGDNYNAILLEKVNEYKAAIALSESEGVPIEILMPSLQAQDVLELEEQVQKLEEDDAENEEISAKFKGLEL